MKTKFLLLGAAVAMMAGSAVAQENLLKNGDFEEDAITLNMDGIDNVAELIPGWDVKKNADGTDAEYSAGNPNNAGMDRWNAVGLIMPITDDDVNEINDPDVLMPEDSWQYFRMRRYDWNGWFDGNGLQQTVAVTPGETYTLSGIYRVPSTGGTRDKAPAVRYVRVFEGSTDGIKLAELQITPLEDGTEGEAQPWTAFSLSGLKTDSEEALVVCVGLNGAGGEGDGKPQNEDVRVDFDELVLVAGESSGVEDAIADNMQITTNGALLQVNGAQAGTPVRVYDVTGKLVYQTVAGAETLTIDLGGFAHGVYVANVGGQSKKFIL